MSHTVLSDFGRTLRDEPFYLVYKFKIYLESHTVNETEVNAWLRLRYAESKKNNRYRVVTYKHSSGGKYVDYVLMETCTDNDLLEIKLKWGFSKTKVQRGERVPRKRLTKEQKAELDAIIERTRQEFYNSCG